MKTKWIVGFAVLVWLPSISMADILATFNDRFDGGVSSILEEVDIDLSMIRYAPTGDIDAFSSSLFEDLTINPSDEGKLFITTSVTPGFNEFVTWITDDINDSLIISYTFLPSGGGLGNERTEASAFFGDPSGQRGIDFQGYRIDDIALYVETLMLESPGSDPNGDGNWTNITIRTTFTVAGVPEPSTLLLLIGGTSFLLRRKR